MQDTVVCDDNNNEKENTKKTPGTSTVLLMIDELMSRWCSNTSKIIDYQTAH